MLRKILLISLIVLTSLLMIASVSVSIYCFITYGNKPITEIPSWAFWFMWI